MKQRKFRELLVSNYSLNLFGNVNISTTSNLPMLKIKNSLDNNINIGIGTNPNNNFLLYINHSNPSR